MITVRGARPEDSADIAQVWHEGWHAGHAALVPEGLTALRTKANFVERTMQHLPNIRLGLMGDQIGGLCINSGDELMQLFVGEAARGGGVAKALVQDAEQVFRAQGYQRVWLGCAVGNTRAIRFYEKCGWENVGEMVETMETSQGGFDLTVWRFEKTL